MNINSFSTAASSPVTVAPSQAASAPAQQNRALAQAVRIVNNSSVTPQDRQLSLSLDPATKIAVAQVVNPTTGQVLDQMPTEDVLRLAAYLEAQSAEEHAAQESLA